MKYRRLLTRADDLGSGNPLAMNAYFAYAFAAAWLGCGKAISPDVMTGVLETVFKGEMRRFWRQKNSKNADT